MQQGCQSCGAPLIAGATFCGDCGTPVGAQQMRAPAIATLADAPQPQATPTRRAAHPGRRRGWYYLLGGLGALLAIVIVVVVIAAVLIRIQPGGTTQQHITTGSHITKIQTGTGFDQSNSLVLGATQNFSVGQAVFVVFTVVNQNPNAQIVLKLFAGSTLELTSDPLNPNMGISIYADEAVVQKTGEHHWEVDYDGSAEASISFTVS